MSSLAVWTPYQALDWPAEKASQYHMARCSISSPAQLELQHFSFRSRNPARGVSFDASVWELWPYMSRGASLDLPPDDLHSSPEGLRDWITGVKLSSTTMD